MILSLPELLIQLQQIAPVLSVGALGQQITNIIYEDYATDEQKIAAQELAEQLASQLEPLVATPDWDGLNAAILGGALNPIYSRLFAAAFGDIAINAAFTVLIPSIQTTRVEAAVAAAFAALNAYTSYRFTDDVDSVEGEKTIWNRATDSLGFSSLMHLP